MRFDIRYRTVFTYTEPVSESQNELRACPVTDDCQRLLDYRVLVHPHARVFSYRDHWATRVDSFGLRRAHAAMEVVADASVETRPRPLPTAAPRLAALSDPAFVDAHIEYLSPSPHAEPGEAVRAAAHRQLDLAGPDVVGVVLAIHRFVGSHLTYAPGSTHVGIGVEDVLAGGRGVCQDFAHLAVAMCRSVGIPARYVSGYLFTDDDSTGSDPDGGTVVVQTHAWFEAAVPGWGWLALDPTNGQLVGERHVKIGHGRSYDDVQPQRGVFLGPASSHVRPAVEIRRIDGAEVWRSAGLAQPETSAGVSEVFAPTATPLGLGALRAPQQQQQQ
jgi:transglutaminase-like putative cysteine protease